VSVFGRKPSTDVTLLRFHYNWGRQAANFLAGDGQRGLERSEEVFGPHDSDDFDFDFGAPATGAGGTDFDPRDSHPHDSDPHDSDAHDSDPHDFWKHEPTRSIPRIGSRRKPAARTTRNSRNRAARHHGETRQIPVIDADGVITLDDTACRPFDGDTGLGGRQPPPHRAAAGGDNSLLRRVGAMMVLLALGVPVAMALRGGDSGSAALGVDEVAALVATQATAASPPTAAVAAVAETAAAVDAPAVTVAGEVIVVPEIVAPETAAPVETAAASSETATQAPALPAAQPVVQQTAAAPVCAKTYEVELGDGWLLIANKHSVTIDELLVSNAANLASFLMVGSTICVPANATTPTTAAATTTTPVTQPAAPAYVAPFSLACAKTYTVVLGDGWLRIANRHSVAMKEVLAANAATASTFLMVGRKICVPANATTPTAAPTTTVKATPTTKAPRPAPTPTIYPPDRTYTPAEVEAIIREIWPDELEEEALRIAKRESHLNPRAQNYCCYGLFQIYYNVHKKWLAEIGITSGEQLLDPTTAARAGLKLYQRNGWGPWKL
jgi:LysM repeat protein